MSYKSITTRGPEGDEGVIFTAPPILLEGGRDTPRLDPVACYVTEDWRPRHLRPTCLSRFMFRQLSSRGWSLARRAVGAGAG